MMDRRSFLRKLLSSLALSGGVLGGFLRVLPAWGQGKEEPAGKLWGFGVNADKDRIFTHYVTLHKGNMVFIAFEIIPV